MDESAECESICPGVGEVFYSDILVIPASALAPDHHSLHLGRHHLQAGALGTDDTELEGNASMCCHSTALAVRVEARGGVLGFLDETGHVLEEQVVHALFVHVLEEHVIGGVGLGRASHLDILVLTQTDTQ